MMLSYEDPSSMYSILPSMQKVNSARTGDRPAQHRHILIVTGPAGSGKSTVGRYLADRLNVPYIEGDEVRVPVESVLGAHKRKVSGVLFECGPLLPGQCAEWREHGRRESGTGKIV